MDFDRDPPTDCSGQGGSGNRSEHAEERSFASVLRRCLAVFFGDCDVVECRCRSTFAQGRGREPTTGKGHPDDPCSPSARLPHRTTQCSTVLPWTSEEPLFEARSDGLWRSRSSLPSHCRFCFPRNSALAPRWIVPILEALLLVALIVADPGRIDRRSTFIRVLSVGLVLILVAGAAVATTRLVVDLVRGGPETNSPGQLLRVGVLTWVYVIIAFSFLFWELDGEGPEAAPVLHLRIWIWHFPNSSTLRSHDQGGDPSSSTICISPSRTLLRSARRTSCHLPAGPNWRWPSRQWRLWPFWDS